MKVIFNLQAGGETMMQQQTNRYYKNHYKFTGKELDEKTGLYDFGARHYNPSWGVWLSVDPMANHPNQVDKTPYAYAWNNPIYYNDPNGMCPDCPKDAKEGDVANPNGSRNYTFENGDWTGEGGTLSEVGVVASRENVVQSNGGNSSYIGTPKWLDKTNIGVSSFMIANTMKEQLISYTARIGNISKTGSKYLKVVKGAGVVGSIFGMGVSGYNIYNDSKRGMDAVNGWDVVDFGVGTVSLGATIFLSSNPIGWGIAIGTGMYFGARLIYDKVNETP